jgi:hypothetical protein
LDHILNSEHTSKLSSYPSNAPKQTKASIMSLLMATTTNGAASPTNLTPNSRKKRMAHLVNSVLGRHIFCSQVEKKLVDDRISLPPASVPTSQSLQRSNGSQPQPQQQQQTQTKSLSFAFRCCSDDVWLQILSFAGPQTISAVAISNRQWRSLVNSDACWKLLCHDYGKVSRLRSFLCK